MMSLRIRDKGVTWLEKTHLILHRMLIQLNNICQRHDIEYFIIYGTLLGAWRSNSFIPWDGDVDVGMTEDNYRKFYDIVDKELPDDMYFQSKKKDFSLSSYFLSKIRDRYSNYAEYKATRKDLSIGWQNGVQLNIFVFRKDEGDRKEEAVWRDMFVHSVGFYITESELHPLTKIEFNGFEFWAPNKSEQALRRWYNNQLYLPPPSQRVTHELRVTPYQSDGHKESRQWYNNCVLIELEGDLNQILRQIAATLSFAVHTRRHITLIDSKKISGVVEWQQKLEKILSAGDWKESKTDVVLPKISVATQHVVTEDDADEIYVCPTSFRPIPLYKDVKTLLLRGAFSDQRYYEDLQRPMAMLYPHGCEDRFVSQLDQEWQSFLQQPIPNFQAKVIAEYGVGTNWRDVTDAFMERMFVPEANTFVVPALTDFNKCFECEPAPGAVKQLKINIKRGDDGRPATVIVSEHLQQTLRLKVTPE